MKTAGYWPCRNEIIAAHLSTPAQIRAVHGAFRRGPARRHPRQIRRGPLPRVLRRRAARSHGSRKHHDTSSRLGRRVQAVLHPGRLPREFHRRIFPRQHDRPTYQRDCQQSRSLRSVPMSSPLTKKHKNECKWDKTYFPCSNKSVEKTKKTGGFIQ